MLSASEINELEKKVFRYRLKQTIRKSAFVVVLGFIFVCIGVVYHEMTKPEIKISSLQQDVVEKNITTVSATPTPSIKDEPVSTQPSVATLPQAEERVKENSIPQNASAMAQDEPIMLKSPSVNMGKDNRKNSYLPPPKQEEIKHFSSNKDFGEEPIRKNLLKPEETFYRNSEEKIDTSVLAPPLLEDSKPKGVIKIETQEVNSIQYLKEKFEKTNNIIFALMLAEEFYSTKNYVESSKWALIANHLDADSEKSWLWFAKSKLKLGQKEDAIVALKAYLKTNKSKAAQTLLNQISLGEINE